MRGAGAPGRLYATLSIQPRTPRSPVAVRIEELSEREGFAAWSSLLQEGEHRLGLFDRWPGARRNPPQNRMRPAHLREPIAAPAGSVVTAHAIFDNSEANLKNPDPWSDVSMGPAGETFEGWLGYARMDLPK